MERTATSAESYQLPPSQGCGHLDGHSGNPAYGDRLDRPSSWTDVAFGLTAAHGIAYQLIEKRHVPWVLVFEFVIAWIAAAQILGFVQFRRGMTSHGAKDATQD